MRKPEKSPRYTSIENNNAIHYGYNDQVNKRQKSGEQHENTDEYSDTPLIHAIV